MCPARTHVHPDADEAALVTLLGSVSMTDDAANTLPRIEVRLTPFTPEMNEMLGDVCARRCL